MECLNTKYVIGDYFYAKILDPMTQMIIANVLST